PRWAASIAATRMQAGSPFNWHAVKISANPPGGGSTMHWIRERRPALLAMLTLAAGHLPALAAGETYPVKPVRYVVPFPAGASPDLIARLITERFSRMWGQQVIVDNRFGAGGTVGAAFAAKAPPD